MIDFAQVGNDLYTGRRSIDFVGRQKQWYALSGVLIALALVGIFVRGLKFGIEFRGGSEIRHTGVSNAQHGQDARKRGANLPSRRSSIGELARGEPRLLLLDVEVGRGVLRVHGAQLLMEDRGDRPPGVPLAVGRDDVERGRLRVAALERDFVRRPVVVPPCPLVDVARVVGSSSRSSSRTPCSSREMCSMQVITRTPLPTRSSSKSLIAP